MGFQDIMKGVCLALASSVLFSGCATTGEKKLFVLPQNPPKNISVYIDNSIDLGRQKNAVETYVWAINNTDSFTVEINEKPTVTPLNVTYAPATTYIKCEKNIKSSSLTFFTDIVTYNYEYPERLINPYNPSKRERYQKKYTAKQLNDESFEIIGFDTKKEAMDVFVALMRSSVATRYGNNFISSLHKAPKPENELFSIDYWKLSDFYYGRGFVFNPYVLESEKRLIVTPVIKEYSLKKHFVTVLKADGYTITENKDDAQMIINTQNLYYGNTKNVKKLLPFIAKAINDSNYKEKKKINDAKNTEALGNQISMASSMGNNNVAGALAGVAALDFAAKILDGGDTDGYFISNITVEREGKETFSIPNYMRLAKYAEIVNQTACIPEAKTFQSARMFLKSIQNKLDEEKKPQ